MSSPRHRSTKALTAKTMASHGRPKLKRPPPCETDLTKAPEHGGESANQLSPASPDPPPRVKTPTHGRTSPLICPEPSKEKSPPNDDRGSPDPNCAICLGKLRNKSFTDSCLHQFCFKCLVQWSKVKPECPLCKQGFKSIIHNVRSNEDYDQYHCRPAHTAPPPPTQTMLDELLGFGPAYGRFRYHTTNISGHRRMAPFSETTIHELFLQHQNMAYVIPSARPTPSWVHRTRRQLVTAEFRASIYDRDMWVQDLPDITGRYRECSPEFYRVNQAQIHRLVPWLNREIPSVSVNNSTHAQVIIDLILSLLTQHHIQSRIMYSRLRPYFGIRTSHFLHEFHTFARSPYDLIGYDQAATYGPNPNPTVFTPDSDLARDSSDSDSDVIILEDDDVEPIAGPSGLRQRTDRSAWTVHSLSHDGYQNTTTSSQTAPLSIDDSDDCEIVNYVKPRHERTPEIIVLSDSEEEATASQPWLNQDGNRLWNRMLDIVNDSLDIDISSLFSPQSPSPTPTPSMSVSSSSSEYIPYTLRSKNSAAKKLRKKGSKNSRTKGSKSCGKATKMKARSDFSDSDEEEAKCKRSRKSRRNKPAKSRSRRTSSHVLPKSPSSSVSYNNLPGTSGCGPSNHFSSDDSLNDHTNVVIPFLEEHAHSNNERGFTSSDTSTLRVWPDSERLGYQPEDIEYKPNVTKSSPSPNSREGSTPPYSCVEPSPPATPVKSEISEQLSNTWCIKPSSSNHEGMSDSNDSSNCSSGSEYHPRLKSIVIMRANNTNDQMHTRYGPQMPVTEVLRGRSDSPVASTSQIHSQPSTASTSSGARSQSPLHRSLYSRALSPICSKDLQHRYKSKSSKKECKRRSRNRSDPNSNRERRKRPRMSKWQFDDLSAEDSSS